MPQITEQQLKVLMSDLNPFRVKSRTQSGRSFSYLEGYDVKATLIRVFGFAGFSAEVLTNNVVAQDEVKVGKDQKDGWRVSVMSTVRLTIHGERDAVYTESAIATSSQPSLGDALDMAIKSASTDALKRAATYLGTQFGLSLYNDGSTTEVVRRVFAPEQQWPSAEAQKMSAETERALKESLGAQEVDPHAREAEVAMAENNTPPYDGSEQG